MQEDFLSNDGGIRTDSEPSSLEPAITGLRMDDDSWEGYCHRGFEGNAADVAFLLDILDAIHGPSIIERVEDFTKKGRFCRILPGLFGFVYQRQQRR